MSVAYSKTCTGHRAWTLSCHLQHWQVCVAARQVMFDSLLAYFSSKACVQALQLMQISSHGSGSSSRGQARKLPR